MPGFPYHHDLRLMEYTRSPSRLEERTFRPSFFFKWPLMKPRTLCVCHPVARMIACSVAPSGRSSIAITRAALLWPPARFRAAGAFLRVVEFLTATGCSGASAGARP